MNTGTHVAKLWTNTGTLMATATFTDETASGWQQVAFPSPIRNHREHDLRHVVSRAERPLFEPGYFAATGFYNPPLEALQDGVAGGNGLYIYSSSNVFPKQSFASSSSFVDAVFTTSMRPTPRCSQSTRLREPLAS